MANIPVRVRNFALRHQINLGRVYDEFGGYYYIRDPQTGAEVDTTRTMNPKTCHALALCKRFLRQHRGIDIP